MMPARWRELLQNKVVRTALYVVLLLGGGAFMAIALARNWEEFRSQGIRFDWRYGLLAVLVYPAGMLPTVAAWHALLRALGVNRPFRTNLRLYSLSSLPRHIPGLVLWVSSRTLLYGEQGVPAPIALTATAAEVILLALTGFVIALPLLIFNAQSILQMEGLRWAGILAIVLLVGLLLAAPALNRFLPRLLARRGIQNPPQLDPAWLVKSLLWMVLAWSGGGLILFVLAQALKPIPVTQLPGYIGIWGAAGAVSQTVGIGIQGLGIRELTISALLSLTLPPVLAVMLAIAFRLALTIGELIWVLIFIFLTRDRPVEEPAEKTATG